MREAGLRLWSDDAFGLAGNIAFRMLLAIFPFLIFTSSLTAFVGNPNMVEDLISFLIAIVPSALIEPIVSEVRQVMTIQRGGVLSIRILLTIWFALGGIDGVRVGLNRGYGVRETRAWYVLYPLMAVMVVIASFVLAMVGYLLVLTPRAGSLLHILFPDFEPLPTRRTRFSSIYPGVLFTVAAWATLTSVFSFYLSHFATYASSYGGLARIVAALYFLYLAALVLIFGGKLNRAIRIRRLANVVRN